MAYKSTDSIFRRITTVINENVGKVLDSYTLTGQYNFLSRRRCSTINYIYGLAKLGYLEPIGSPINDPKTTFKVLKPVPEKFSSVRLLSDLKAMNESKSDN